MTIGQAFYSDVDIEMLPQTDGDITRDVEYEAVINSLKNIFNTIPGTRRMLPDFAVDIWGYLFEPMDEDTALRIGNDFLRAIETWDDRVIVQNIHVHANYDNNQYEVKLTFRIQSTRQEATVNFILSPGG
jgi:phage baseplate assembly protein W